MTSDSPIRVPVAGFSGYYEVDSDGKIWRIKNGPGATSPGRPLTATVHSGGYRTSCLTMHGKKHIKYVHRVVAESFLEKPEDKNEVNHKNGIKHDNRVSNLEWVNRTENIHHAKKTGLDKGNKRKLTNEQIFLIRYLASKQNGNLSALAKEFGVNKTTIYNCARGSTFKWIP